MKRQGFIWEVRNEKGRLLDRFYCLFAALNYLFWNVPSPKGSIRHKSTGVMIYQGIGYDKG